MSKIAIVTDSTSDIPKELQEKYDIHVMPLSIIHGDKSYLDGVDIKSDEFYSILEQSDVLPKSSQPSPDDFIKLYKKLLNEYEEIISIHLSQGLSGTVNAAFQAKKEIGDKVNVFDSRSISVGIGLQVLDAAKNRDNGLSSAKIIEKLEEIKENTETIFTLDTLEYLYKGGRIGKVSNIMGSLLNIKPIIRVEDGIYVPNGKARSQKAALDKIVKTFEDLAKDRKPISLSVAHGAGLESAKILRSALEKSLGIKCEVFTQVGPVIGVHTGPGTIGAAVQYES
ncbi:DegV family protein with EDD domain [Desulfitispora alkaliphila]|uniref:DegV family protein n=1 Tax=Desulfitispora alkaliphila TaxID=622674 RepID=UPI003D231028